MEQYIKTFHIHNSVKPKKANAQDHGLHAGNNLKKIIIEGTGNCEIFDFIDSQINLGEKNRILLSLGDETYVNEKNIDNLRAVVNLKPVNKIKSVKNYLIAVHKLLPDAGLFVGCVETYSERKIRFKNRFKSFWKLPYTIDFVLNRVFPRLIGTENIYKFLTKDSYHVMSKAEMLGRLVYSGFDIIDYKIVSGKLYYVAMKTHEPSKNIPSYHPLIKLRRIGKNGKTVGVYKMRTMHPYSEYIQSFVVKQNGYNEVGKPANDFRLTSWGKFMRKLWLDEMPQFINVILGQMKLVGVRPLSQARFNELPEEVQRARINHTPGCFPPYVALCMPDEHQNIEAEVIYMDEKSKHPFTTDIKYFYKSVYNILANKIRSS
jgi:lipopolysaccharide/colanic/teichoic acid biosynthesis glycosyltransferase